MAPVVKKERRTNLFTFKADPGFMRKVDLVAQKLGISRSELIRIALEAYVRKNLDAEPSEWVKSLKMERRRIAILSREEEGP
ncbi:MAG: hypothetical protein C4291_14525 [Candidatus Dadabacteria bacterium]